MRIGVDFDGVVTDVAALMVTYAAERLGAVLRPEQIVPPAGPAAIGAELYQRLIDETHATPVSLLVEPLPTAMEALLRLGVEHDLVVVTARYGDAMGFAERWLEGRLAAELQEGPACAVLVGVERPELAGALPPELVAGTVARLRARYERVVVDLGSPPDPGALRATDHTLLVTAADLVSLWNARLALRSLGEDEGGRWSVIVNRREGREHYAGEEIERALAVPVLGVIREDRRAARRAIERQAALSEVGGKAAADLEAIAHAGADRMRASKPGPLRWSWRRRDGEPASDAPGAQAHQLEDVRRVIHEQIAAAERRALTLGQPFADTEALARRLLADLLGLGPLQPLLDDPAVEEIIVNGPRRVFVIADGRKELTEVTLPDDSELLRLVRRAIGPLGGRLNLVDRPVTGAVCRRVEPCTLPPHSC